MPKASALRFHQSNGSRLSRALLALRKYSRVLRHRRAPADCFGANPVASALGTPARRDPGGAMRTYHEGRQPALKTGTFYLAGNRNFLFGSDRACVARHRHCGTARLPAVEYGLSDGGRPYLFVRFVVRAHAGEPHLSFH